MKVVYAVLVLTALVFTERRLIEPRLTGARLSALAQAAFVYTVLVYTEWIPTKRQMSWPYSFDWVLSDSGDGHYLEAHTDVCSRILSSVAVQAVLC